MHVINNFDVSLQIVVQKLEKEGLAFRGFRDDIEFVEHSEAWKSTSYGFVNFISEGRDSY